MKFFIKALFLLLNLAFVMIAESQTLNFASIDTSTQIIHGDIGWDYGSSFSFGYIHKLPQIEKLSFHTNLSVPFGRKVIDDFKFKVGGQFVVFERKNWKGSVVFNGIYRRCENPLVRLQNIGGELKGVFGFYRPKWFIASELGFDKAILTHFKHSNTFREYVYSEVKDGWYEPSTGGNLQYGFQLGYSQKKIDLIGGFGKIVSQDFKTTPLIPFYLMIGCNYKIK